MAIRRALKSQDPLAEVAIDRSLAQVVVESELPREELARAITDEGYTVEA